jgi:preprotein translocase subunit SecG
MSTLHTVFVVVQVLTALLIIALVLLQHGKGADMGAAFGSGASGSLFGATGSSNFLSKATGLAAAVFFAMTLGLAFIGNQASTVTGGVMDNLPVAPVPPQTPATGAPPQPAVPAQTPVQPAIPAGGAGQAGQIPK